MQQFTDLCFSGQYDKAEIKKMIMGNGGLKAYLGTSDVSQIIERIDAGDEYAKLIFEAMGYQISKEIGAMSSVLNGRVDNIILTGGLAHSDLLTDMVIARVKFIAPVIIYQGEFEMDALADGVYQVLNGKDTVKTYQ